MNGPLKVYHIKPVFQLPSQLDLPACMYRMKNPVACVTKTIENFENDKQILSSIMDKKPIPELGLLEARWDSILKQLSELKLQITSIKKTVTSTCELAGCPQLDNTTLNNLKVFQGAVINANPARPPYSLLFLKNLYRNSLPIIFSSHIHSTVPSLLDSAKCFMDNVSENDNSALKLLIIWKDGMTDTELVLNPIKQLPIRGEVNILRYFARSGFKSLHYPAEELIDTIQIDSILDISHRLLHVTASKEKASLLKNLNAKLGKSSFFGGENINICDVAVWSVLKQLTINTNQDLSQNMAKWFERINKMMFD